MNVCAIWLCPPVIWGTLELLFTNALLLAFVTVVLHLPTSQQVAAYNGEERSWQTYMKELEMPIRVSQAKARVCL